MTLSSACPCPAFPDSAAAPGNISPGRQVAWIKSENQGILSINEHVISDHARLSVVRNDVNTWTMTLRGVHRDDSGSYICQVNTDPVQVQVSELCCTVKDSLWT